MGNSLSKYDTKNVRGDLLVVSGGGGGGGGWTNTCHGSIDLLYPMRSSKLFIIPTHKTHYWCSGQSSERGYIRLVLCPSRFLSDFACLSVYLNPGPVFFFFGGGGGGICKV